MISCYECIHSLYDNEIDEYVCNNIESTNSDEVVTLVGQSLITNCNEFEEE